MPRSYRQISQYEKEIIELYNQGMTLRAIAEKLGFTHKQVQCLHIHHLANSSSFVFLKKLPTFVILLSLRAVVPPPILSALFTIDLNFALPKWHHI